MFVQAAHAEEEGKQEEVSYYAREKQLIQQQHPVSERTRQQ